MTQRIDPKHVPTVDTGVGAAAPPTLVVQLWRHRRLLAGLARTDFAMRYSGALFGLLWAVVLPLIQAVILIIVFSRVSGLQSVDDYSLYVVAGIVWWNYFSQSLASGGTAIVSSGELVDKLWFPRVMLPLVPPVANLAHLAITTSFVVAMAALGNGLPGWRVLLLIPLTVMLLLFTIVLAALTALAHAWFRDVGYALHAVLILWFYVSPIIYEPEELGKVGHALDWNPMGGIVDLGRAAVSPGRPVPGRGLLVAAVVIVVGWVLVEWSYRRYAHDVADLL